MRGLGIQDSMRGFPDEDQPTWDNQNPFIQSHWTKFSDRRVDMILTTSSNKNFCVVENTSIVLKEVGAENLHVSDHYGVICEVRLR